MVDRKSRQLGGVLLLSIGLLSGCASANAPFDSDEVVAGATCTQALKSAYQQADPETILRVVLEAGELREVR